MPPGWFRAELSIALVAIAGAVLWAQQQEVAPPIFRTDVNLTVVEVTVRDRDGQLLTDLRQSEFQVLDMGTQVQIEQFAVDRQPLTAAVMIQTAGDMPSHAEWAALLVDSLGDGDRLRIGSYGTEVAISPVLTSDPLLLRRILREELWYGSWTPVAAAMHLGAAALPADVARPAVLLIGTDPSEDECNRQQPCVTRSVARQTVLERGALVYAIVTGLGYAFGPNRPPTDTWNTGPVTRMGDRLLQALTKETGGYLATRGLHRSEWPNAARAVLEQLRVRYVLGFVPHASGALVGVNVKTSRPGTMVRIQKSHIIRPRP